MNSRISQMEEACSQKLQPLRSRATEIGEELNRSRGRLPMVHGEQLELLEGRHFKGSPMEVLRKIQAILPQGYKAGKEEGEAAIVNYSKTSHDLAQSIQGLTDALQGRKSEKKEWVDDPNEDKQYRINLVRGEDVTGVHLALHAKSIHQDCSGECCFGINGSFSEDSAVDFVKVVSRLLFAALPTSDLETLQTFLAQSLYGLAESDQIYQDGVRLRMVRKQYTWLEFEVL